MRVCPCCDCTTAGTAVWFRGTHTICEMCRTSLARRGKAWCNICKSEIAAADWRPHDSACVRCQATRRRKHYLAHQEREQKRAEARRLADLAADRARKRAYYHVNRERIRAAIRARYAADPEPIRAKNRAARRHMSDRIRASRRDYLRRNRAHIRAYQRNWHLRRKLAILRQMRGAFQ